MFYRLGGSQSWSALDWRDNKLLCLRGRNFGNVAEASQFAKLSPCYLMQFMGKIHALRNTA